MNLDQLFKIVAKGGDLRNEIIAELRAIYATERYEGVDCPHEGETVLLEAVGAKYSMFEQCSLIELIEIVDKLRTWTDVLNP